MDQSMDEQLSKKTHQNSQLSLFVKILPSFILFFYCRSTATSIFNHMSKWFSRLAVLEARGRKRSSLVWTFYLPVIFFAYGVLLGKT